MKLIDITGRRFGRLFVVRRGQNGTAGTVRWECLCDCGTLKTVSGCHLRHGHTISCRCVAKDRAAKRLTTHGDTIGGKCHPVYRSWRAMHRRCQEASHPAYHNYGGRGIKVCGQWRDYATFKADMHSSYRKGLTLDRIDSNGDYEPKNCRWVDTKTQARNRRTNLLVTYNGKTMPLAAWEEEFGVPRRWFHHRFRLGWPPERVFNEPMRVKPLRKLTHAGQTKTIGEWATITGLSRRCIVSRLNYGWPVDRILTEPKHPCGPNVGEATYPLVETKL